MQRPEKPQLPKRTKEEYKYLKRYLIFWACVMVLTIIIAVQFK